MDFTQREYFICEKKKIRQHAHKQLIHLTNFIEKPKKKKKWTASSRAISWPVVHRELWISATSRQCNWKRDELIAPSKNDKINPSLPPPKKSSPRTPRTCGRTCLTLAVFSADRQIAVNMQVGFVFVLTVVVTVSGTNYILVIHRL